MDDTRLIALDWGTTSLRAYRVGRVGQVLEKVTRPLGIRNVPGGDFDGVFAALVDPWRGTADGVPVIACGMIGSRQGWVEVPYVESPAGLRDLAGSLTAVNARGGGRLWIVPGVSRVGADGTPADGVPDVMRGEETQLVGAGGSGLVVLPGTHSKWAWLSDGRIDWFATFMTGELFGVLRDHSILGALMDAEAPPDAAAFARGLAAADGMGPGGGLLHRLFTVRAMGLFGLLDKAASASYLSGLLIGAEVADGLGWVAARLDGGTDRVRVVGDDALALRYAVALERRGVGVEVLDETVTVSGLTRIADAAGLI